MNDSWVEVLAPCKVNLSLDILGLLPEGYHSMEMLMQTVSLCDTLRLEKANGSGVVCHCNQLDIPTDERNLAVKAAYAFMQRTGTSGGIGITLHKHIPHQAGLGGGSADAAGVLVGLNQLLGTGLSQQELCQMGLSLGADVPFCIVGGTALAQGVGEKLTSQPALPSCYLLLAKPAVGISTAVAFRQFDAYTGELRRPDTAAMLAALQAKSLSGVAAAMGNVFQQVVQCLEVEAICQTMCQNGALQAVMSGSGSAVVGIFETKESAQAAQQVLQQQVPFVFLAEPTMQGPQIASQGA